MGDIVEWEQKESIYVLNMIDENDNSKKKMMNQCFCSLPSHIPYLKDLEHEHLSFEDITLLLKCNFLFHRANVH